MRFDDLGKFASMIALSAGLGFAPGQVLAQDAEAELDAEAQLEADAAAAAKPTGPALTFYGLAPRAAARAPPELFQGEMA